MGPGLLVKSLLQGSFSLMVFGWAQILMDLQPLIVMITGEGHLHGFSHTYVGASLIGIAAALTGKHMGEFGLRVLRLPQHIPIRWPVAIASAFIGTFSHVLLDSIMHSDLEPFAPFNTLNPFLYYISIDALHYACLYSGIAGAVVYYAVTGWVSRRKKGAGMH
jgi:membrane-bound metal-dependent hydrolase YbcI (DUF457 family)